MRRMTIGILGCCAITAAGCGSGSTFANRPRPPIPVNLTVYINDARVSVSPDRLGAGPIVFIVTNQASHAENLQIQASGQSVADTGPINPQANATVKVTVPPGTYTMTTNTGGATDAALATASAIQPARLLIGPPRPSAKNQVLQP
jgi:hypothetical protein